MIKLKQMRWFISGCSWMCGTNLSAVYQQLLWWSLGWRCWQLWQKNKRRRRRRWRWRRHQELRQGAAGLSSVAACAPAGGSVGVPLWAGSEHWQRTTGTAAEGESETSAGRLRRRACHCQKTTARSRAAQGWWGRGEGVVGQDWA